jgi:hypothetical protein
MIQGIEGLFFERLCIYLDRSRQAIGAVGDKAEVVKRVHDGALNHPGVDARDYV